MLKIFAGRLQSAQQDVLVLLELEPKEPLSYPGGEMQFRFYKIVSVQHIWYGEFDLRAVEGTHIFQSDFEAYTFPPREFFRAQAQLVRELRRKGNDLRNQMNNVLAEANRVAQIGLSNERI